MIYFLQVTKGDAVLESVDTGRHNPGAYQVRNARASQRALFALQIVLSRRL